MRFGSEESTTFLNQKLTLVNINGVCQRATKWSGHHYKGLNTDQAQSQTFLSNDFFPCFFFSSKWGHGFMIPFKKTKQNMGGK